MDHSAEQHVIHAEKLVRDMSSDQRIAMLRGIASVTMQEVKTNGVKSCVDDVCRVTNACTDILAAFGVLGASLVSHTSGDRIIEGVCADIRKQYNTLSIKVETNAKQRK